MIKKSTCVAFLCALVLGGAVYYFDWKHAKPEKPAADALKPAYSFQASEVTSLTISHPSSAGEPALHFEKRDAVWQIVQPIQTNADQSTIDGIVAQIAGAEIGQTEPAAPDRLKIYGLEPPRASVEFVLRNGAKHTLLVGDKDFTGDSVYTIVDGGQSVSLLPALLSIGLGKRVEDLRDRFVLHFDAGQTSSFSLKNSSGGVAAMKAGENWRFTEPGKSLASKAAVDALLQSIAAGKMVSVASETPADLGRYGLSNPAVTFTAVDDHAARATLLVGKKDGDAYFARDASRPMIFRISDDFYKKLIQGFDDLRDKSVVQTIASDLDRILLRNANGSIIMSRKKDSTDDWIFDAPNDQKGKSAAGWKILDVLTGLKAEQVIDHPAANLLAQFTSPAVTVVLTDKSGEDVTVRFSKPSADLVYAQSTASLSLYKVKKSVLDDLNLTPADLIF